MDKNWIGGSLRAAQIFYGAGKRTKTRALYEELPPVDQQVPENNEYIRYCNCDPGWVRAPSPAAPCAAELSAVAYSWAPTASSR